jgi:prepilin signal peptidase PulO-like enzyme (type II secretory pathway)
MIELAIIGAAGASVGSFLGAYASRWPAGKSLFARSSCDHCHARIRWFDLIPVLSFILLRGRCRRCRAKISISAIFFEVVSLGLALFVVTSMGLSVPSLLLLLSLFALMLVAVTDWRSFLIPDAPLIVLAVIGVAWATIEQEGSQDKFAAGMLLPGGLLLAGKATSWAMGKKSLGFGDVKLAGALGLLLGLMNGFLAIWIASVLGLLYRLSGYRGDEARIPFGALIAISAGVILLVDFGVLDLSWLM